ncbi:MAG: response regulator transcription factor [Chloroflexota bacterium]|nr:response regulator transcription factor [Chloroflexota bacterium]
MNVLVVEDSREVVDAVSLCFELRWPGANVVSTSEGEQVLELIQKEPPDVIILDLVLPGIDGFEVLRQIRRQSNVPVVILSVKGDEMDKVRGLELGADDYIVKPFAPAELLARVKAVLRRTHMFELNSQEKPFVSNNLKINFNTREVLRGETLIKLTPTEYSLLCQLVKNEGRVLTHQVLLEKVWGSDCTDAVEYLRKYIQRLREKLEDNPENPRMFLSERGLGYKFVSAS